MEGIRSAIVEREEGVIIEVYVTPNAKRRGIAYNRWRRGFEVKIDEKAAHGRANDAIIAFFADLFGVERSSVRIVKGFKSKQKRIELKGVRREDIIKTLKMYGID
ncbi:MAG: DUF167 domain-containing protein [Candidatus Syntropharchaeales archaeon]